MRKCQEDTILEIEGLYFFFTSYPSPIEYFPFDGGRPSTEEFLVWKGELAGRESSVIAFMQHYLSPINSDSWYF